MTYDKSTIVFEPHPRHHAFQNLTGQVFNGLAVLGFAGSPPAKEPKATWYVECVCGNIFVTRGASLKNGHTRSCGCIELALPNPNASHGLSNTPEYQIWCGMRKRCNNTAETCHPNYGGRGITVCARWNKFENFYMDMGKRPTPDHSIERKDNNGNYEPSNCYWATVDEQANNKRNNHVLTFNNKTQTLTQWAREVGIPPKSLQSRLVAYGWSVEEALTTPMLSRSESAKRGNAKRSRNPITGEWVSCAPLV